MPCPIYEYKSIEDANSFLEKLANRNDIDSNVEVQVQEIQRQVRENGDTALSSYNKKFDYKNCTGIFKVSAKEIEASLSQIPLEDKKILEDAIINIRQFHELQKEKSWFHTKQDGTILGQKVSAIARAGIYVPGGMGGNTPLISSLFMGAIPAQVAGVKEIAVVSPPREDGTLNPYILAAANLLGISEVYAIGGAWSIFALAYGTKSIKAVDIITGPGNAYVTMAKRLVNGYVGIDMIAGPSEIFVLADSHEEKNKADMIASDLISQAEHDTMASSLLVTDSKKLANEVLEQLKIRLENLPRADIARKSLADWSGLIVLKDMQACVDFANIVAPEHLEVFTENPWDYVPKLENAGALFLGSSSAESIGDYFAGPNHVLPTMSTARFASGLSTQTFMKKTNVLAISKEFMKKNADAIARFARLESLEGHACAAEARK